MVANIFSQPHFYSIELYLKGLYKTIGFDTGKLAKASNLALVKTEAESSVTLKTIKTDLTELYDLRGYP